MDKDNKIPLPLDFSEELRKSIPGGSHYKTDELLDLFIEKNDLSPIKSKIDTRDGTSVVLERGSHFILKSEPEGGLEGFLNPRLERYIGPSGDSRYTSVTTIYRLSGEIEGIGHVDLEAEMSTTTHYRMKKSDPPFFTEYPVRGGEPSIYKNRKDNYDLWFVIEPLGEPKETGPKDGSEQISLHL